MNSKPGQEFKTDFLDAVNAIVVDSHRTYDTFYTPTDENTKNFRVLFGEYQLKKIDEFLDKWQPGKK